MAFTAAQKQQIRNYLGAPAVFRDLQHMLEGAMDQVGTDAEAVTHVTTWLTRLAAIDTALTSSAASSTTYGALKRVDEIEFHPIDSGSSSGNTIGLVNQGRVLIGRIARILGVSHVFPEGDYFGTQISSSSALMLG